MDYVAISEKFFDDSVKSIIYYSTPCDYYDFPAFLDALQAQDINKQDIDLEMAAVLARGKHPFMIIQRMEPLVLDYTSNELLSHLAIMPYDQSIKYMLWFYLLTTEQLEFALQEMLKTFTEREVIKMTPDKSENQFIFTNVNKDELLIQINFLPTALPGSIFLA